MRSSDKLEHRPVRQTMLGEIVVVCREARVGMALEALAAGASTANLVRHWHSTRRKGEVKQFVWQIRLAVAIKAKALSKNCSLRSQTH